MPNATPPPLEPEAGAVWREFVDGVLGGTGPRVAADTLDIARSFVPDPEALLASRRFEQRELRIPGPAGEMTISLFTPEQHATRSPGMFWIHGGGMVAGNRFAAVEALEAADAVGAVVGSVEYRLAPEHPAPAPVDDCYAALHWFAGHAGEFGVDPSRIVLGGASAGGGLAAATALRIRDHGGPDLAGLLLCCPMLDDRMTSTSTHQFGDDIPWTRDSNTFGWASLLGERAGGDAVSIYEAPGRATDLSGLPPSFIDVGSVDLFRDEDVAFASTIWACGGDAELHVWPGGYHGFELMAPTAQVSQDAYEARRRWLVRILANVAHERRGGSVAAEEPRGSHSPTRAEAP